MEIQKGDDLDFCVPYWTRDQTSDSWLLREPGLLWTVLKAVCRVNTHGRKRQCLLDQKAGLFGVLGVWWQIDLNCAVNADKDKYTIEYIVGKLQTIKNEDKTLKVTIGKR